MILDRDATIALRFSAGARAYDRHAAIQRAAAQDLLRLAPLLEDPDRILEIGCGTGALTELLVRRHPGAVVDALDPSPGMLRQARSRLGRHAQVRWHHAGLLQWDMPTQYSLVVSNAALHWVEPLAGGIVQIRRVCRPDADVVCAMMVAGTLCELHEARRSAAPSVPPRQALPAEDTVTDALHRAGFAVVHSRVVTRTAAYPSARAVLLSLHAMGLTGGGLSRGHRPLTRRELQRVVDEYDRRFSRANRSVPATYRILYFHARPRQDHRTC
jgi:malonyl-CoA O-methyltransferase